MGETRTTGLWDENSAAWHDRFSALADTFHHGNRPTSTPTIFTDEISETACAEPPTPISSSSYIHVPSQALDTIASLKTERADYDLQGNRSSYPSAIASGATTPLFSSALERLEQHDCHDSSQEGASPREDHTALASTSNMIDTHVYPQESTHTAPILTHGSSTYANDYFAPQAVGNPGKDPGGERVGVNICAQKRDEDHNHLSPSACQIHSILYTSSCSSFITCIPHIEGVPTSGKDLGRESVDETWSFADQHEIRNHPHICANEARFGQITVSPSTAASHNVGDKLANDVGLMPDRTIHTEDLSNPGKDPGGEKGDAPRHTDYQGGNSNRLPICGSEIRNRDSNDLLRHSDTNACQPHSSTGVYHKSDTDAPCPDAVSEPRKDPAGPKVHLPIDLGRTSKSGAKFPTACIRSLSDPGADRAPSDLGHKHALKLYNKASVNGAYERWKAHRRVHIVLPMADTPIRRRGEGKVRFALGLGGVRTKKPVAMTIKEDTCLSGRGKSDSLGGDEGGEEKDEEDIEVRTGSTGEFDLEDLNVGSREEAEEEDKYEEDDREHAVHPARDDLCCWTSPLSLMTNFSLEDLDDEATSSSSEDEGERSLGTSVSGSTSLSASRASLSLSPESFTCNIPALFSGDRDREELYGEVRSRVEDLWGSGVRNGDQEEPDGLDKHLRRTNGVHWAKDVEDAPERASSTLIEHGPVWAEEDQEEGPLSPLECDDGAFFRPLSFCHKLHHFDDGVTEPCVADLDDHYSPQREVKEAMRARGSETGNKSPTYIEHEPGGVGIPPIGEERQDGLDSMTMFMDAFAPLQIDREDVSNNLQPLLQYHPLSTTELLSAGQSHSQFDLVVPSSPPLGTYHAQPSTSESWSLYPPEQGFAAGEGRVPASPSRRRSRDLPGLEGDLNIFSSQELPDSVDEPSLVPAILEHQNTGSSSTDPVLDVSMNGYTSPRTLRYLSLPGAETDDELIPQELAPHNFVPDTARVTPATPSPDHSQGGLLLWGIDGRSPKVNGRNGGLGLGGTFEPDLDPDSFYLDPRVLANLPNDAEARKVYDMRQRHRFGALNSLSMNSDWEADKEREREKAREMADLLRLKLGLDAYGAPTTEQEPPSGVEEANINAPGVEVSNGVGGEAVPSSSKTVPGALYSPPPPPLALARVHHHKPTIASMDQLVANMVFHRQQDAVRRKPSRSRTWSPPALVASGLGSGSGSEIRAEESKEHATTIPGCSKGMLKTPKTPLSPLRQMLLAEDMDDGSDDDGGADEENGDGWLSMATLVESPGPLSPLYLYGKLDV